MVIHITTTHHSPLTNSQQIRVIEQPVIQRRAGFLHAFAVAGRHRLAHQAAQIFELALVGSPARLDIERKADDILVGA